MTTLWRMVCVVCGLTLLPPFGRCQGFAPDTLAGMSAVGAVTSGNGFLAPIGAFRVTMSPTGTAFTVQSFNPAYLNSATGGASYTKTGANTARMALTDVVVGLTIPYVLAFSSATTAAWTITTGLGNQTGVLILEKVTVVQNVLPPPPATIVTTTAVAGLSNMSVRTIVPTNGQVIPGLVLDSPTRVLVRVAGPALAAFGVTGTLPNPRLTVLNGSTVVATNDDWSDTLPNQMSIQSAALRTGAFSFAVLSKDAALVLDLPAGSYTCLITGEPGTSGEVILELYRVPQ